MTLISFIVILHSISNQSCCMCWCCKTIFMYFISLQFHFLCYWIETHKRNLHRAGVFDLVFRDAKYSQFTSLIIMSLSTFHVLAQFSRVLIFPVSLHHIYSSGLGLFSVFLYSFKELCISILLLFPENFCNFFIACSILNLGNFSRRMVKRGKADTKIHIIIIGIFFEHWLSSLLSAKNTIIIYMPSQGL